MKNVLLTLLVITLGISEGYSQWKLKKVDKRDLIYEVLCVRSHGLSIKIKVLDTNVVLYLKGNFFGEANPFVTMDFYTNQGIKSHSFKSIEGYYENVVILTYDLKNSKAFEDLKNAYQIKVTIYDSIVDNTTIMFNTQNYLTLSNNYIF